MLKGGTFLFSGFYTESTPFFANSTPFYNKKVPCFIAKKYPIFLMYIFNKKDQGFLPDPIAI